MLRCLCRFLIFTRFYIGGAAACWYCSGLLELPSSISSFGIQSDV